MSSSRIGTTVLMMAITCLVAGSVQAQGSWQPGDFGSFRFRLGSFQPDGNEDYWRAKEADWFGEAADLEDIILSFEYVHPLNRLTGVMFGANYYEGSSSQAYRDYVDGSGNDITHRTSLETAELSVSGFYRFRPLNLGWSPYIGGGAAVVFWELRESGDFIDFTSPDSDIISTTYRANDETVTMHAFVGIEVLLADSWAIVGEARWRFGHDGLNKDFEDFGQLDLSGFEYSLGVSYNF